MGTKGVKKCIAAAAAVFLVVFSLSSALVSFAIDDDAYNGYAADGLTIKVGYAGGPYYTKKVYTLEEIESMPAVTADYTFIDNMPSVVIDHAKGVRLQDLMDEAGIDMNSIENFYFYTVDKQDSYFTTYPKTELIDTPRYCYYSLPDNFDSEAGVGNAESTAIAEPVDTIISYADDWNRVIKGAEFGSDYENLNTATRFRLIFGQVDASTRTASRSAKWIHEIDVQLGGCPKIVASGEVNLDMKVGSQKKLEISIKNVDDAIQTDGAEVQWRSSDESVATVDENGNVTVVGEGSAIITATLNGVSTSFTVNGSGSSEEQEEPPQDNPENPPQDNPEEQTEPEPQPDTTEPSQEVTPSSGNGSGNGSGSGRGNGSAGNSGSGKSVATSGSVKGSASTTEKAAPSTEQKKKEEQKKEEEKKQPSTMSGVTLDDSGGSTAVSAGTLDNSIMTDAQDGGVQNWRVYEMSEDAQELAEYDEDNPLLGFTKAMLSMIFAGGGGAKLALFRIQTGAAKRKREFPLLQRVLKRSK